MNHLHSKRKQWTLIGLVAIPVILRLVFYLNTLLNIVWTLVALTPITTLLMALALFGLFVTTGITYDDILRWITSYRESSHKENGQD